MVTTAPTRPSEAQQIAPAKTWPRAATVLDSDGAQLTNVDVLGAPRDGRVLFGDVWEPAALLDQYFGRGAQIVMLTLDDAVMVGRLATCWDRGHRSWWIELDGWTPTPWPT
jgi:hypothetical protein